MKNSASAWKALPLLVLFVIPLAQAKGQSAKELLATGRVDAAIDRLQGQVNRSATDAESNNLLCRAYFMLDDWDHGIAACERAVRMDPQNSLYHLWLGRIYGEKADKAGFLSAAGLAKKVRAEFERAVILDPKSWPARTDLAEFYLEAPGVVGGGKDKARAQAEAIAHLNPAAGHWINGRIAEKGKDDELAEREYRAAIEASQGGAHAWLNLALFFRHSNRRDDMEQALRTLESSPLDRPESLLDGGSVVLRSGRDYALGVRLVQKYLSSTPVEEGPAFKAHYVLGQLLEKQGDRKAAAEQYRTSLEMAHEFTRAQEALKRVER